MFETSFLFRSDLQVKFLSECVPPPVGLEPIKGEVRVSVLHLEILDTVDDGLVAELLLMLLAVVDHLLLGRQTEVHLGQDPHPVLIRLPK